MIFGPRASRALMVCLVQFRPLRPRPHLLAAAPTWWIEPRWSPSAPEGWPLLTRDAGRYHRYFPNITLIAPPAWTRASVATELPGRRRAVCPSYPLASAPRI